MNVILICCKPFDCQHLNIGGQNNQLQPSATDQMPSVAKPALCY